MLKRSIILAVLAASLVPGARIAGATAPAADGVFKAGAAVVDANWHLGASQGQYADIRPVPGPDVQVDPYTHHTWKEQSYGLGSNITTRALVFEDGAGDRIAIVTNDLYIPQDLLTRRVASLVTEHDTLVGLGLREGPVVGIGPDAIAVTVSHSHASPYYSTPAWGPWLFQDIVDVRFFEYMASRMADAIVAAAADLRPARIGGATVPFNEITSHTYGPQRGDDGTPAGQPWDFTTGQMTVVRIDDIGGDEPSPLATWVVHGVHPEWVEGDGLLTGDITTAIYRMTDREIGGVTLWSDRETGTAGPHKDLRVHGPEKRREFQDLKFSATDRAARIAADRIAETYDDIEAWSAGEGTPEIPHLFTPFTTDPDVDAVSVRVAPPFTRPYPGISNCNTRKVFQGNPGVPVMGLPDCGFPLDGFLEPILSEAPINLEDLYDQLREVGAPIPVSYSPAAFMGLEETLAVRVQAMRIGEIGITFSPTEQFTDSALNIQTKLDRVDGNEWVGFDWADQTTPADHPTRPDAPFCEQNADTTWTCADTRNPRTDRPPVSDLAYRRMRAQINNPANGWEDDGVYQEAEPTDPAQIKGNFTHGEVDPAHRYELPIAVNMANDYWGYVPPYREYRAHDHYRKALSGLGPHGADFLNTRLVTLAASLKGGPVYEMEPLDLAYQAESARTQTLADALGLISRAYTEAYEQQLPSDAGTPAIVEQPGDIKRFDAAFVTWIGGNTYDDMPDVRVERLVDGTWQTYGDLDGEVQTMVTFPTYGELPAWRAGEFTWRWTASFEAFVSELENLGDRPGVTPTGTYRFVIDGVHRGPEGVMPYHLTSETFDVSPWGGVRAHNFVYHPDGALSFLPGPGGTYEFNGVPYGVGPIDYPNTYDSPFEFITDNRRLYTYGLPEVGRHQMYCSRCSFRPWADGATVVDPVAITIERAGGGVDVVYATWDGGRWSAPDADYHPDDIAYIAPGALVDEYGEFNSERSDVEGPWPFGN